MEKEVSLKKILKEFIPKHFAFQELLEQIPSTEPIPPAPPASRKFKFLWLLEIIPYFCLLVFIVSFFWDFQPEHRIHFFANSFSLHNLLRTISIGGLIGFGTNWLAIKMLFKPQKKRPIWGQGLIPAQKYRLSDKIATAIHNNIFNETYIKNSLEKSQIIPKCSQIILKGTESLLNDPEFLNALQNKLEVSLTEYFQNEENKKQFAKQLDEKLKKIFHSGIKGIIFKAYTNLQPQQYKTAIEESIHEIPRTIKHLFQNSEKEKQEFINALKIEMPSLENLLNQIIIEAIEKLNLYEIFRKQLYRFNEGQLEEMIWGATNEQLRYIRDLGGALGILGGLIIWQPFVSSVFLITTVGILAFLDYFLEHK